MILPQRHKGHEEYKAYTILINRNSVFIIKINESH